MSFILNPHRFGAAADPGLTLLQSATLWLSAADGVAGEQTAVNQGTGGSALDARYGSTTGVDTNDPLLLTHTGTNYLYLPGSTGNTASTPDAAPLDITDDIDIQVRLALADWTPTANSDFLSKGTGGASTQGYGFTVVATTGILTFYWSEGATARSASSTVAPTVTDGAPIWIRATRERSSGNVKFYTSPDATSPTWTQLGTTVATGFTGAMNNVASTLLLGGYGGATPSFIGSMFRVIVRNGYDGAGSVVFDADFTANTNQSSFTESSSNAATVTINRSTSGRKAVMVTRPVWLFGTDDYMEIADNALLDMGATDPFTVLVVGRAWGTQGTNDTLVAKKANVTDTTAGYLLANHGTTALQLQADIGDGTNGIEATSASRTAGDRKVWAMVRSVASDNLTTYINTTAGTPVTDATTATLANAEVLRIGRLSGAGTEYADVEIDTVVLVKGTAYDSTQIGQIMTYLGVS